MRSPADHMPDLRREDGVLMPVLMMVLATALILIAVGAKSVAFSGDSANRDRLAKRAQQAADAGVAAALDRMDRLDVTHGANGSTTAQCVGGSPSALTLTAATPGGWCPAMSEDIGNGGSYSYQVRPVTQGPDDLTTTWTLVSTGSAGGVTRRVAVDSTALTGQPLVGHYSTVSLLDLNLNQSATITGDTQSNGNINLNGSQTRICGGTATPGPGQTINPASRACTGGTTDTPIVLAPVNQGDAGPPTNNNSNARICAAAGDPCSGSVNYNPTTRRLLISGGSLTLSGSVYSFCQLDMEGNSQLNVAPGASVQIYIDSPEHCPGQYPALGSVGGMSFSNNSSITNPSNNPTHLQLYVVGSSTAGVCSSSPLPSPNKCGVVLGNNNTTYLMLYAPNSAVELSNNLSVFGAVAAKQITMSNNTHITYQDSVSTVVSRSVYPVFKVQGYRECAPAPPTGSDPSADC
jgi:hypothetical protein